MARWKRVLRGMLGMGLTFSAGAGIAAAIVVGVLGIIFGFGREMLIIVVGSAIWAFLIGVGFSGVMALTAGGTSFEKLSLPRFAALGTGVGLLCFGVLAINAWDAWSTTTAIVNAAGPFAHRIASRSESGASIEITT